MYSCKSSNSNNRYTSNINNYVEGFGPPIFLEEFMKKINAILLLILTLLILLGTWDYSHAASSATQSQSCKGNYCVLKFTWIAHTDGTFTSVASGVAINGYIVKVITNPGSTAPTALYDITLTNTDGEDVVHGALANRSATATEAIVPIPADNATVYGAAPTYGIITLNISNNSVNSGNGTVSILYEDMGVR